MLGVDALNTATVKWCLYAYASGVSNSIHPTHPHGILEGTRTHERTGVSDSAKGKLHVSVNR